MDLHLYLRVMWRFRLLVLAGVLVGLTLAFLSSVRVGFEDGAPTFEYRENELWAARATVLVTEAEFPLGRSVFEEEVIPAGAEERTTIVPSFAPSSRFNELANVYAHLVPSDPVKRIMLRDGPVRGKVEAVALMTPDSSPLPLLAIGGVATTPERAAALALRATRAFQVFLTNQQRREGIPPEERVVLSVIRQPTEVELLSGRSKTLSLVVFLTAVCAAIGLAFILENLRPRVRPVAAEPAPSADTALVRRSA